MIQSKAGNWCFQNILYSNSLVVGDLTKQIAIIERNGSHKMDFQVAVPFVLHYIILIKIREPVIHQLVAVRFFQMLKDEF